MPRQLLMLLLLLTSMPRAQSQVVESSPSRLKNYLPVEGGGMKVNIDTITSLDSLIGRLFKDWDFKLTGKAYWIGYTEDMYSIAARGDSAIQPLVEILQNSSSNGHARYGAVYTLHLIGINSTVAGRFYEKFVNPKARVALLQFLKDSSLQETIMRLLMRDPWQSDIPVIMEAMKNCEKNCWPLVNGLTRYKIDDLPIRQTIPGDLAEIAVEPDFRSSLEDEEDYGFGRQIREVLESFRQLGDERILIEDTLFKSKLIGDFGSKFDSQVSVQGFFRFLNLDSYITLGSRVQYYVSGDKLFICSPETAKKRLVEWWTRLAKDERESFKKNHR